MGVGDAVSEGDVEGVRDAVGVAVAVAVGVAVGVAVREADALGEAVGFGPESENLIEVRYASLTVSTVVQSPFRMPLVSPESGFQHQKVQESAVFFR